MAKNISSKEIKKQRNFLIGGIVFSICVLSIGYAAFQTNISLTITGNTKNMKASEKIKSLANNNTSTMFTDPFGNIRYTGSNEDVKNYVCLKDENPCQDSNLFRIVGSFKDIDDGNGNTETRVKVIKATPYTQDIWNTSGNNWAAPAEINTKLNSDYLSSLDSDVQNLIGNTVWNLGGISSSGHVNSYDAYINERGNDTNINNVAPAVWTGKVALIYPSDYGYASKNCYSNTLLNSGDDVDYRQDTCKGSNWLYLANEFFLSPAQTCAQGVSLIDEDGVYNHCTTVNSSRNIRPTLFLKSNTKLITNGHDGSSSNPYIVKIVNNN